MGVPKFFRYICERYPCLNQFVKEHQMPVFDNLYLDMNGIIHTCSHPDDNNPYFRITEEKIFIDVFHYIEFLFRMIKPKKLFFMAVDGVAPRAKMNQQRGRRFRSAKEAQKLQEGAKKKGEKLPEQERFDSNCITPGTEFMARLHEQLKYFIASKISNDKMWRKCKIILSGHETPGEGEHKIMDYIRYLRSQPDYDPNTRHCLYGLDADLIMLGLCTHELHFSLLREEVKFGKKKRSNNIPEEIRFYLMHLSLMREYLELEFESLKESLSDKFKFDIEKIIDDWILMGFLVGNDFIPNLPNLHIVNGALPILYKIYIEVLPTLDGYINEQGKLNLERFEKFMKKLSDIDIKNFEEIHSDMMYFEAKTGRKQTFHTAVHCKSAQNDSNENDQKVVDSALITLLKSGDEINISSEDESSDEDEDFKNFKNEYYRNKLEYEKVTPEVMREQAEGYVRAIQWNLNYYYNGVCSWSWFYPHHYSPYISDIKNFANLKIDFDLGKPFKPYEQLLAVLPTASKTLLPKCYHDLMTDKNSIIRSYYPEEFQTDLNGKRQEWEAIVLVPFIDEQILLDAMEPCNELLTIEEKNRNTFGPMLIYEYVEEDLGLYEAPNYFPSVTSHARCTSITVDEIRVPKDKLIKGLHPGAHFDVYYPGFSTMKHLNYKGELAKGKVKVFETPSRNENMILKLSSDNKYFGDSVPLDLLGRVVWVGWPHLSEAKVVALSNVKTKYVFLCDKRPNYLEEKNKFFGSEVERITKHYKECLGIELGTTQILVYVQSMIGRKYTFASNRKFTSEKQFSQVVSIYPLQSIVCDIRTYEEGYTMCADITEVFPVGSICFSLTQPHYGSQGTVMDSKDTLNQIKVLLTVTEEPDFSKVEAAYCQSKNNYQDLASSAMQISVSNYVFSRITGSLYISLENSEKPANIGLNLKFNKKNEETPGYTRKIDNTWFYSNKAVDIVRNYLDKYPEIFDFLSHSREHDITTNDLLQIGGEEKVKEILIWLKQLPTYNADRRVCGSDVLDEEMIAEIEKMVDCMNESPKTIVMQIKPHLLFKSEIQNGDLPPDPLATTKLFDRVVNVREGFTVPFGLKGTVIGIYKSSNALINEDYMYDVVFDKTFAGGMALNCSVQKGYRVPGTSFINVSHGKRQMEQKTGVPGALRAWAKEQQCNGNNSIENYVNFNKNIDLKPQNSAFASFNRMQSTTVSSNNFYPKYSKPLLEKDTFQDLQSANKHSSYTVDSAQAQTSRVNNENSVNQKNTIKTIQKVTSQKSLTSKPRTEVDTDFLKRILNIESSSDRKLKTNVSQESGVTWNGTKSRHNELIQPSFVFSTKKNYGQNSSGKTRLTFCEKKTNCGRSASTREKPGENVVQDALKLLSNNSSPARDLPYHFPTPPTNWVEKQNKSSYVFLNKSNQDKKISTNLTYYKKESEPNRSQVLNNNVNIRAPDFVPLQALKKKQTSASRAVEDNTKKSINNDPQNVKHEKIDSKSTVQGNNANKVQSVDVKNKSTKSGRPRRTRIAANFHK